MVAGAISKGVVDNRDIRDVKPFNVEGFKRAHFFAGIGVWDYALNSAELDGPLDRVMPLSTFQHGRRRKRVC